MWAWPPPTARPRPRAATPPRRTSCASACAASRARCAASSGWSRRTVPASTSSRRSPRSRPHWTRSRSGCSTTTPATAWWAAPARAAPRSARTELMAAVGRLMRRRLSGRYSDDAPRPRAHRPLVDLAVLPGARRDRRGRPRRLRAACPPRGRRRRCTPRRLTTATPTSTRRATTTIITTRSRRTRTAAGCALALGLILGFMARGGRGRPARRLHGAALRRGAHAHGRRRAGPGARRRPAGRPPAVGAASPSAWAGPRSCRRRSTAARCSSWPASSPSRPSAAWATRPTSRARSSSPRHWPAPASTSRAAWALSRAERRSLNVEGARAHVLTDLYASLAAAAAGLVVLLTGAGAADGVAALLVAALMVLSGWRLLRDSAPRAARRRARGLGPDARSARRWPASPASPRCTTCTCGRSRRASRRSPRTSWSPPGADCHARRHELERLLRERFGIVHTTLQVEHEHHAPLLDIGAARRERD